MKYIYSLFWSISMVLRYSYGSWIISFIIDTNPENFNESLFRVLTIVYGYILFAIFLSMVNHIVRRSYDEQIKVK